MMMPLQDDLPVVTIDLDNQAYWEAASRHQLSIGKCQSCEKFFFYPRPFCPLCLSDQAQLVPVAGKGEIYSFTVVRRVARPYVVAFVKLPEGPAILTNIVDCDVNSVRIGQAVEVVFVSPKEGPPLPMFRPVASAG